MEMINQFGTTIWLGLVSPVFLVITLYFTLTFFQQMKAGNQTAMVQSKLFAVICLAIALIVPVIFNIVIFLGMNDL